MKVFLIGPILFFLCIISAAQNLDLIVNTNNDSIACKIDSASKEIIHFKSESSILNTQAQKSIKLSKGNIYLDAGTHIAGQATINIERRILSGVNTTWYGRVGGGYAFTLFKDYGFGVLGAVTMITGKKNNHFEINGGAFLGKGFDTFVFPLLDLGYRYQKPEGGFIFRAKAGVLGVGIGLGYAF